jgi:hypothetical protein
MGVHSTYIARGGFPIAGKAGVATLRPGSVRRDITEVSSRESRDIGTGDLRDVLAIIVVLRNKCHEGSIMNNIMSQT